MFVEVGVRVGVFDGVDVFVNVGVTVGVFDGVNVGVAVGTNGFSTVAPVAARANPIVQEPLYDPLAAPCPPLAVVVEPVCATSDCPPASLGVTPATPMPPTPMPPEPGLSVIPMAFTWPSCAEVLSNAPTGSCTPENSMATAEELTDPPNVIVMPFVPFPICADPYM